ncbi:MAG: glycosyltransferase family 4 protein [Bacteroidetes bacterium]|nr:glycosyltransferase family 4 protein [Bacteroidota bacterium]
MHIALITDGIWPYVLGGMQKHSYYLCKYLAQNKVKVDLIHFNDSAYDISKLEFFSDEEKKYIHSIIVDFPAPGKFPGHYLRNSYLHSKLIFNAVKERLPSYDFIYTKGFTGWHLIQQKKGGKINCAKIGVKFHGHEMFQRAPDLKTKLQHIFLLRKPVKEISLNADVVFSYGGKITGIIKSLGIEDRKIIELPSGVEASIIASAISPALPKLKFLFLGRYERRKGIEELNLALKNISNQNFDFHFIGPIPFSKQIQRENIKYHGEIRDKEALNILIRTCDVLVCPSWSEGLPNVILEAMANGLCVIASDAGATNVLVNKNNGWLLRDCDPPRIQEAMMDAITSSQEIINQKKQMALNQIRDNFKWEKLINELLDKIQAL